MRVSVGLRWVSAVVLGLGVLLLPSSAFAANANLSVTKSDSPDPVAAGSNITYTITANAGTSRTGYISVSGVQYVITQTGLTTIPPSVVSLSPNTGFGNSQLFTARYSTVNISADEHKHQWNQRLPGGVLTGQ